MATDPMRNPVLIELTRGALVESVHAGAIAVVRADGEVVGGVGDIARPDLPALRHQAAAGAAVPRDAAPPIASASARRRSRSPAARMPAPGPHVAGVTAMLAGAGLTPAALACGAHEPTDAATARELIRSGASPTPLHHNCSGKHAAMLATAGTWPSRPRATGAPTIPCSSASAARWRT